MKSVALRLGAVLSVLPAGAGAQAPLPDFLTCLSAEAARFERTMRLWADVPELPPFAVGGVTGVSYCGGIAITRCDRTGDPIPCQQRLVKQQDAVQLAVRAHLPAPEALAGAGGELGAALYPLLWALAGGSSAGPDCAGAEPAFEAWCEAWAANDRLATAIHAWELARVLGAARPAVAQGWAVPVPPMRPRAREAVDPDPDPAADRAGQP